MDKKTKEILDRLKNHYVLGEEQDTFLLNYITNLQKENENLKDTIKKDNHILGCNFAKKEKYNEQRNIYKKRNEKAIEYIEKCRNYHRDIHHEEKIFPDEITSLLMILKGDDE